MCRETRHPTKRKQRQKYSAQVNDESDGRQVGIRRGEVGAWERRSKEQEQQTDYVRTKNRMLLGVPYI